MPNSHGHASLQGLHAYCDRQHHYHEGDRFGRIFEGQPPLFTDPRVLEALGHKTGPMHVAGTLPKTQTVPIGFVFFGQFVDHDITLDISSSLDSVNSPDATGNVRTPTLDLDCVYGTGPEAQPYLYYAAGTWKGVKLITAAEQGKTGFAATDLARVGDVALIGDFRNDENRLVSQVQLAMIRFHNRMAEDVAAETGLSGKPLYEATRQRVTWHYQWAVVHDYLGHICGAGAVNRILAEGRRIYRPHIPFIPVEFSVAAYRFGHSMVPMKLQVQQGKAPVELFGATLGTGFSPVPNSYAIVDLHEIFETFEGRTVERASRLDAKMADDLLALPGPVDSLHRSLATRNMVRGQSFLLPSGETVARCIGRPDAEIAQIHDAVAASGLPLGAGTPLWFYILKEAELIGREEADGSRRPGEGLGPVGATLVAETVIGLIELDPRSWLGANRNWRPGNRPDMPSVELSTVGHILTYS